MGVCSSEDVDLALTNSSGNPIGPISVAKEVEPFDLAQRLERLANKHEKEIFNPTQTIRKGRYRLRGTVILGRLLRTGTQSTSAFRHVKEG